MLRNTLLLIVVLLSLSACATAPDFSRISIGQSKDEVISRLGKPTSQAAKGGLEYLIYGRPDSRYDGRFGGGEYFVQLMNGRVTAYGTKGDFDTTALPIERKQIETIQSSK